MPAPERPADKDRMIYGVALLVAVSAGGAAIYRTIGGDAPPGGERAASVETDDDEDARRRGRAEASTAREREAGVPREVLAGGDREVPADEVPADEVPADEVPADGVPADEAPLDVVPALPEVPDLATEPPPPRPRADDPRLAQLGAEMRLLTAAREAVVEHPREALGILEQHRRLHPDGVLSEEREAFAVEALLALEHVAEAERRYYEFRRRFPSSDFTARLEELMQRPPHAAHR